MGALRFRSLTAALVISAAILEAAPVRAQVDNAAIAEELFNDAKRLLDQGKTDLACPKFAESLRLDPTLGTRLNLAHCYEVQGRTATAWGQYKEVVRLGAGDPGRAGIARSRITALEPTLSRVLIQGATELGLKLVLDGDVLDAAIVGTSFPIDPGDHHLQLLVAGKKTRDVPFHVDKAQTQTVDLPGAQDATETETPPPPPPVVEKKTEEKPPEPASEVSQGKRIGGWVAIGAGAVAVGVGVTFGVLTLGLASDVHNGCPTGPCPTQDLIDKNSAAHTDAILSDILIPVGVVAAGLGVYLVLTSSHRTAPPPTAASLHVIPLVSPNLGGLAMVGRF